MGSRDPHLALRTETITSDIIMCVTHRCDSVSVVDVENRLVLPAVLVHEDGVVVGVVLSGHSVVGHLVELRSGH